MVTPDGIYASYVVPQGSMNAVAYTQSNSFRQRLNQVVAIWIDDILGFARTWNEYLDTLQYIFTTCRTYNLKLSAVKASLLSAQMEYCGRIVTAAGIKHDDLKVTALLKRDPPVTSGELQQFYCGCIWFARSLPDFPRTIAPLRQKLTKDVTEGKFS